MDLSNKNGQPSMEEILASIRRIIAEEPTADNPVIDIHAKYRNKADDHDENNDFELPSIFRPAAPTAERQPLFGRLTDAIRNASNGEQKQRKAGDQEGAEQERYRGALRDSGMLLAVSNGQGGLEAASNGHHQTSDAERYRGALRDSGSLTSALSSLKMTRGNDGVSDTGLQAPTAVTQPVAPAHVAAPAPTPVPAAAPVRASSGPMEDVRRVMVPFKDQRMSGMGGMSSGSASPMPAETTASLDALFPSASAQDFGTGASAHVDFPVPPQAQSFNPQLPPIPAPPRAYEENLSLEDMHRFAPVVDQGHVPPPPPPVAAANDAVGIEDTTADLLRPMLRQWLSENMPRMVEKALSIELAESVKSNRKFNG